MYIVEIEAIIGDISLNSEVCNINKPLIIREFKGSQSINTSMPASLDSFGKNIIDLIGDNLSSIKILLIMIIKKTILILIKKISIFLLITRL